MDVRSSIFLYICHSLQNTSLIKMGSPEDDMSFAKRKDCKNKRRQKQVYMYFIFLESKMNLID